jgi:transcriptional regulator with XRE-family HTH domain
MEHQSYFNHSQLTNNSKSDSHLKLTLPSARKRMNLTLRQAADKVGIPYTTLRRWEKDSSKVRVGIFLKLCKLYYIELSDLFLGTQKEFEAQVLNAGDVDDEKGDG